MNPIQVQQLERSSERIFQSLQREVFACLDCCFGTSKSLASHENWRERVAARWSHSRAEVSRSCGVCSFRSLFGLFGFFGCWVVCGGRGAHAQRELCVHRARFGGFGRPTCCSCLCQVRARSSGSNRTDCCCSSLRRGRRSRRSRTLLDPRNGHNQFGNRTKRILLSADQQIQTKPKQPKKKTPKRTSPASNPPNNEQAQKSK